MRHVDPATMNETELVMAEPERQSVSGQDRVRRCIATRAPGEARHMVRFVLAPDGTVVPDVAAKLPGRGFWVGADRGALTRAVARGGFAKAARARVSASPTLVDQVDGMLARRCLDRIGLARRAGEVVAGFDQCADLLRRGRASLVLTASDGGSEGRRRLEALAGDGVAMVDPFTRAELGAAIGRDEIVHLALSGSGHAASLLDELERLRGFRDFRMPQRKAVIEDNASIGGASRT